MLIRCQKCDREISDKAGFCPGCGEQVSNHPDAVRVVHNKAQKGKPKWKLKITLGLIFLFVIITIFYIWGAFFEFGNLVKAAACGDRGTVERLLWLKSDLNWKEMTGFGLDGHKKFTPLGAAARSKHWKVCRILLEHGADPTIQDSDNMTPLHYASRIDPIDDRSEVSDIVEQLIKRGAYIEAKNQEGETPLHVACRWFCSDAALELIRCGADVNARTPEGRTPLHLLAAHVFGSYESARKDDIEKIFDALVTKGADINSQTYNGRVTPLHDASYMGHTIVVQLLLKHGANANTVANLLHYGKGTPLQCARKAEQAEVVKLLEDYGAK